MVGLGQLWRGDDALGWLVVRDLPERAGVRKLLVADDMTRMLEIFEPTLHSLILVDAVRSGAPPGTFHRLDLSEPPPHTSMRFSSHSLNPLEVVELARRVKPVMPSPIVLLGLEGAEFAFGSELSEPVSAALPLLIQSLLAELA